MCIFVMNSGLSVGPAVFPVTLVERTLCNTSAAWRHLKLLLFQTVQIAKNWNIVLVDFGLCELN